MYIIYKHPAVSTLLSHCQIIMWGKSGPSALRTIMYMNRLSLGKLQSILLLKPVVHTVITVLTWVEHQRIFKFKSGLQYVFVSSRKTQRLYIKNIFLFSLSHTQFSNFSFTGE
jgi:hypothetical protein